MAIRCPKCEFAMNLKGAKPGRYTPRCTECKTMFVLIVPKDPTDDYIVRSLPSAVATAVEKAVAAGVKPGDKGKLKSVAKQAVEETMVAPGKGKAGKKTAVPPPPAPPPSDEAEVIEAAHDDDEEHAEGEAPVAQIVEDDSDRTAAGGAAIKAAGNDDSGPGLKPVNALGEEDIQAIAASVGDDDGDDLKLDLPDEEEEEKAEPAEEAAVDATMAAPAKKPAPLDIADDEDDADEKPGTAADAEVTAPPPAKKPPTRAAAKTAEKDEEEELALASPEVTAPSGPPRSKTKVSSPEVTAVSKVGKTSAATAVDKTAVSTGDRARGKSQPPSPPPGSSGVPEQGSKLGGYEIVKQLGMGGMGAVYLARQLSLDRNVAVKTMHPQWAEDPQFVARFTREAYAAAQLVHHNVVQIYDIGEQDSTNFFSMEFVEGKTLGGLVKEKGKLDPEEAVGYILQAARGLKFAHDQGMVHRDIKPDNLMLNSQGIVKVADLGLVKTPGGEEAIPADTGEKTSGIKPGGKLSIAAATSATRLDVAMGTPAYMAPEQGTNAAGVDARADIYSLGCTLYVLLTGKPPFEGTTAVEVMTKHAHEQMVPPDVVVKRVPKSLSAIILKMTAKKPEDRYKDMGQVIKALEEFLGINSTGPFTPREEHANLLESCVTSFNTSSKAKLRKMLVMGFYGGSGLAILLAATLGGMQTISPAAAASVIGVLVGLMVLTTASYIVVTGVTRKTFLFRKIRQLIFGSRILDWIIWLFSATAIVMLLHALGWIWWWLGFVFVAAGIAVAFHVVIDRMVKKDREGYVNSLEEMLRSMRLKGLEEQTLRQFVCKYSGDRWEEMYEELFGYEAKIEARANWGKGDKGEARKKHAAWRDSVIGWIDNKMRARKEAKEKKLLQKMEEKALKAKGLSEAEAKKKAEATAETMVAQAAEFKEALAAEATMPAGSAPKKKFKLGGGGMGSAGDSGDDAAKQRERARKMATSPGGIFGLIGGRLARLALGFALVYGTYMWMQSNHILTEAGKVVIKDPASAKYKPLAIPFMPDLIKDMFNGFNVGIAGLILLVSIPFGRYRCSFVLYPAVVIMLAGAKLGIPAFMGDSPEGSCLLLGGFLSIFAIWFLRD